MSHDLKTALAHVFWLGGPSDAGKTTVANILLRRRRWQGYPCDLHEHNHLIARVDPALHPVSYRALGRTLEESWLQPTPEELFENILATNDERFPMICDDLRAMPRTPPVLVEGPRLFPKLVEPALTDPHQAIWLLPTDAFVREAQRKRNKPTLRHQSSDPERFRLNFLARERLLAEYIRREVVERGLPYVEVDGRRSPEEIADLVEAHFAGYTPKAAGVDARLTRHGGLSYLEIPAPDCRRSALFYAVVLGWTIDARGADECRFADATGHLIGRWVSDRVSHPEAGVLPYFYVSAIEDVVGRVTIHGGEVVRAPYAEGNLRVATIRDPAGNLIGLWEATG